MTVAAIDKVNTGGRNHAWIIREWYKIRITPYLEEELAKSLQHGRIIEDTNFDHTQGP